jgi:hypothetical protein
VRGALLCCVGKTSQHTRYKYRGFVDGGRGSNELYLETLVIGFACGVGVGGRYFLASLACVLDLRIWDLVLVALVCFRLKVFS